jgi:nucleotide-binding universal stress UspA family protein
MFRNIVVPVAGTPADAAVFATARQVAEAFGAHLEFLHVRPDTTEVLMSMTAGGVGGGDAVQAVIDRMEAESAQREAAARSAVDDFLQQSGIPRRDAPNGAGASAEFTVQQGSQSVWVAQYGRFADLVVMGRGTPEDGTQDTLEAALMDTGKPLLIAPARPVAAIGATVVVAWKDTPEAARAVSAALPFIARAGRVLIATISGAGEADDTSAARLQRALRWHNPAVELRPLRRAGGTAVEVLHADALAVGADLLVMGGYSHSRLREVVFGGFTRHTLTVSVDLPVLMAH